MALKAFKYRLYPNVEQKILIAKHFGVCRYVYNRALELKENFYKEQQKSLSIYDISGQVTQWKKSEETEWLKEVNSQSIQMALKHLDIAFTGFFKKKTKFPTFKKKHDKQSFSCPQNCKVDFNKGVFYLPKFKGGIKTVFHRKFNGQIKTCTISKTKTDKYYASILVEDGIEAPNQLPKEIDKCLGIDMGIKDFLIASDGTKINNPKHLKKKNKKLKRLQRQHSKKKKGSKNREKSRKKLAVQHEKVANSRSDFLHKISRSIADNQGYTSIAIETLNINGMMKNHKLAGAISDAGWGMFSTFLEYKLKEKGKTLIKIGQYEPSSKKCGNCEYINKELALKDRKWVCPKCGTHHDRDVNAAKNIKTFAFCEQDASSKKISVGQELPEFTLGEIGDTRSLNQEAPSFRAE